jgi:hypothetical protein
MTFIVYSFFVFLPNYCYPISFVTRVSSTIMAGLLPNFLRHPSFGHKHGRIITQFPSSPEFRAQSWPDCYPISFITRVLGTIMAGLLPNFLRHPSFGHNHGRIVTQFPSSPEFRAQSWPDCYSISFVTQVSGTIRPGLELSNFGRLVPAIKSTLPYL